jgi:4-hydroxy-tetrahydrodipicolinate reductase
MGKEVEEQARVRGHRITAIIDNENEWLEQEEGLKDADVAIEFSLPQTAKNNILRCFNYGLAVVSGTTGWMDALDEVRESCMEGGHAFFYASNFSPGMNIMFEINSKLARLMSKHHNYRILIEEIHHAGKKDSPSGTAITLANEILRYHPIKKKWVNRPANDDDELEIISVRRNQVAGTHYVKYDSEIDSLEIRHTAHSRKGFALGALLAAEYIQGKKGCFNMQDLLYDKEI